MKEGKTIIDIHCHTAGIGAGGSGCFVSSALRASWKYRIYLKAFGVSEEDILREGDGLIMGRLSETLDRSERVSAAVVLAMDGVADRAGGLDRTNTEIYIPNEFVAAQTRMYPNLLFGASINPYRNDSIGRLDEAAAEGAVLIKWLPSIQHIDPADRNLTAFYLRMAELGLPLLVHTGAESSFTRSRNELGDPGRLRLPLQLGVTVIAAHAASNGRNDGESNHVRFLRLCSEFSNLYADVSALTQINRLGHLTRLLKHRALHSRLLYGTDMPLLTTGLVTPFAFPFQLSLRQMFSTSRILNPWDRDVALKKALGVTGEIFGKNSLMVRQQVS